MRLTKIQFSKQEMDLLTDSSWILTKNAILEKLQQFLGELHQQQKTILEKYKDGLPGEVLHTSAKISKGENYKGLPWLVLDFPRYFVKEEIFAIRTMFWWGNFFSTTLHLSGRFKETFQQNNFSSLKTLEKKDFAVCIADHQWHHTFEETNYKLLKMVTTAELKELKEKSFLKLAKKIPLKKPDVPALLKDYEVLVKLFRQ